MINSYSELLKKIKEDRSLAATINSLGGLNTKTVQSDKIGYDWLETYIGDVLMRQEYIEQEIVIGNRDNPFHYDDEAPRVNNAFYIDDDGNMYVYMSGEFVEW